MEQSNIKIWSYGKCSDLPYDENMTLGELKRQAQGRFSKAKISLFYRNMPLEGFGGFSMKLLKKTFGELYLVHDANQFNDMTIHARRDIRIDLCRTNNANTLPICIEFQLKNQFVVEKYLLSTISRLDVLASMCGRHVPHCAIAFENLYFPVSRLTGLDKLESVMSLLHDDGMLHVVASETYRYQMEDYLLESLENIDRSYYRALELFNPKTGKRRYMVIGRRIPMRILGTYFSICSDYHVVPEDEAYPLIEDLDEDVEPIKLVIRCRKQFEITPPLQFTIAIDYRQPLLYFIKKSNILIVYNVQDDFVVTAKTLPIKESLSPYQERLPAMLTDTFLMSEILMSGVSVFEFSLEGKLLREITYPWSPTYKYELVCLDYITVKINPALTRNEIWRVHKPNDRLIFEAEPACKIFISKVGHSYNSHHDLIAVYLPKKLELNIYKFSEKSMKHRLKLNNFITWVSFSLCGEHVMYSNDFQQIEECELATTVPRYRRRMHPHEQHFYDDKRRLMCIKNSKLWVEGEQEGRSITMAVLVINGLLCRVSESDHLSKVLFM